MSEAKVEKIKVRSTFGRIYAHVLGFTPLVALGSSSQDPGGMSFILWNPQTETKHAQGSSFATGLEVQEKRKRVLIISTGSKNVDTILGGDHHPIIQKETCID